jgi:hypothetical protein
MICTKCNSKGVENQALGKTFYYCRSCKDEISLEAANDTGKLSNLAALQQSINYVASQIFAPRALASIAPVPCPTPTPASPTTYFPATKNINSGKKGDFVRCVKSAYPDVTVGHIYELFTDVFSYHPTITIMIQLSPTSTTCYYSLVEKRFFELV